MADALNGYNLANDKVWNLYASLTGDDIREQPFWAPSSGPRNAGMTSSARG